jgi:putative tryptophan/tyrosine transport system substrate-binding protein
MNRRKAIASLVGSAVAFVGCPRLAHSQISGERPRRIGLMLGNTETDPETRNRVTGFRGRLAELGWVEGRNATFHSFFGASDPDRIQAMARELVNLGPDVILVSGTPAAVGVQKQTRTIPVVFTLVADPVPSGLAASLAHPGENITGFMNYEYSIGGKWLEVLREVGPSVRRILVIHNPANAGVPGLLRVVESTAASFGLQVSTTSTLQPAAMHRDLEAFAGAPDGGLVVFPDATTTNLRDEIVASAARYRLPAVYPFRYFAASGGLMSYGIDAVDQFRQAASYVDRILKGTNPADLPVQAPTKFELVINLKTAKALGLDIPLFLQQSADEVME